MSLTLLAIESSCDDTSAAVLKDGKVLSNIVSSQKIHEEYGGVVPELASREHQANIIPVVTKALKLAGVDKAEIDGIAFTKGPGLLGSLLVGVTFAKSLALALDIPLIEVHHMKAHVMAHYIDDPVPNEPFLCLTVSGGHTQIVKVNSPTEMRIIGNTIDDAAGEAFDKAGKMLGLDYPAGPLIDKYAKEGEAKFHFNKPKIKDLDFSFSGLKTSILYSLKKWKTEDPDFIEKNRNDLCASIQSTIIEILIDKLESAARQENIKDIAIAGGVSANSGLRQAVSLLGEKLNGQVYIPQFQYCTDNAAMIGISAHYQFDEGVYADQSVKPDPRMVF